jgi:hypothetical protein
MKDFKFVYSKKPNTYVIILTLCQLIRKSLATTGCHLYRTHVLMNGMNCEIYSLYATHASQFY